MNSFEVRLREVFGGSGSRWKSAAAEALRISRPTLYRYLSAEDDILAVVVPKEVFERLGDLAREARHLPSPRELATGYAKGLRKIQEVIDRNGYISAPYPDELLRALSIAAALNYHDPDARYPDNLAELLKRASEPLYEWFADLDWDQAGDFTTAQLIRNGVISAECELLASALNDQQEREGFDLLMSTCRPLPDGQGFYVVWRRLLIEKPVIESLFSVLRNERILLCHIDASTKLAQHFFEPVPRRVGDGGEIALCPVTGTPVSWFEDDWVSESRDPDIQAALKAKGPKHIQWTPDTRQVRRVFRQFWVIPGHYELALYRRATKAGWDAELWPRFDQVDLVLRKGKVRLALDVKDYINSFLLAKHFKGFQSFARDHRCMVVVPSYLTEVDPRYRVRFNAVRRVHGKAPVEIKTVAEVMDIIEAGS